MQLNDLQVIDIIGLRGSAPESIPPIERPGRGLPKEVLLDQVSEGLSGWVRGDLWRRRTAQPRESLGVRHCIGARRLERRLAGSGGSDPDDDGDELTPRSDAKAPSPACGQAALTGSWAAYAPVSSRRYYPLVQSRSANVLRYERVLRGEA